MAKIKLQAYPLNDYNPANCMFSISLSLGTPQPSKEIEARNVADIASALDVFATEMTATGKPWMLSSLVMRGERAPNGYKKAERDLRRFVNSDKAPGR